MSATPQFDLKTGADSSDYFSREVTKTDINDVSKSFTEEQMGLIKDSDFNGSDLYEYPVLVRRTGDSLKGTTESIESNELRKGRTKSAPRKGNSSSEGSLDFEFSPETYDDILEAALRGKWTKWEGDSKSPTNLDDTPCLPGHFLTKIGGQATNPQKLLVGPEGSGALIETDAEVEVHELACGNEDIRYSVLKEFGGTSGDELYQEYQHECVNTVSFSVTPGQIVTGSFGFMGSTNPKMFPNDGEDSGIVKDMDGRFASEKTRADIRKWLEALPKKGTSTDQYTAREGFLYINGARVRYGSNLSFELNNGLKKVFAIFEKDSISTSPLQLDITGSLSAYLIKDHTDRELYNLEKDDADVEVVFCFQNKEENPDTLYVVQIFKTKFTDTDISSGAEELEVTFPFQSFEERACRILRIRRRKPMAMTYDKETGKVEVELSTVPEGDLTADDFTISLSVDGTDKAIVFDSWDAATKTASFTSDPVTAGDEEQKVGVTAIYNECELKKTYTVEAA